MKEAAVRDKSEIFNYIDFFFLIVYSIYSETLLKRTYFQHNSSNRAYKKCFHSYLYVNNKENLDVEHDFNQSLEIRYSGV